MSIPAYLLDEMARTRSLAQASVAAALLSPGVLNEMSHLEIGFEIDADVDLSLRSSAAFGTSQRPGIVEQITSAAQSQTAALIRVDLGDGQLWWSTRLYLLAALLVDYTWLKGIVVVASSDGMSDRFVGVATSLHVRLALANLHPSLERFYREAFVETRAVDQSVADFFRRLQGAELKMKHLVTPDALRQWLGPNLIADSLDWIDEPDVPIDLLRKVVASPTPYVALVKHQQLRRLIDRSELATRIATIALMGR